MFFFLKKKKTTDHVYRTNWNAWHLFPCCNIPQGAAQPLWMLETFLSICLLAENRPQYSANHLGIFKIVAYTSLYLLLYKKTYAWLQYKQIMIRISYYLLEFQYLHECEYVSNGNDGKAEIYQRCDQTQRDTMPQYKQVVNSLQFVEY